MANDTSSVGDKGEGSSASWLALERQAPSSHQTAAELIRRKAMQRKHSITNTNLNREDDSGNSASHDKVDLDEEIRRLEEELLRDDDTENESDSSSTTSSEDNKPQAIVSLSESKDAKIESLPDSLLPSIKKRALKSVVSSDNDKVKKKKCTSKDSEKETDGGRHVSEGLKFAVQEILRGYQPRSAERLPFYCRVCAKQFENDDAFNGHKEEAFHKTAVVMERKVSFCKLCRKQLTSPAQLQEHLRSKPHKMRLQTVQCHQQQRNPRRGGSPCKDGKQWS